MCRNTGNSGGNASGRNMLRAVAALPKVENNTCAGDDTAEQLWSNYEIYLKDVRKFVLITDFSLLEGFDGGPSNIQIKTRLSGGERE